MFSIRDDSFTIKSLGQYYVLLVIPICDEADGCRVHGELLQVVVIGFVCEVCSVEGGSLGRSLRASHAADNRFVLTVVHCHMLRAVDEVVHDPVRWWSIPIHTAHSNMGCMYYVCITRSQRDM